MMKRFLPSALSVLAALILLAGPARSGTLHPALENRLGQKDSQESLQVLVAMKDRVDVQALDFELRTAKSTRGDRHRTVVTALQAKAAATQGGLLAELDAMMTRSEVLGYTSHWLVNAVVVTASPDAIRALAGRADVDIVEPDLVPVPIDPVGPPVAYVPEGDKSAQSLGVLPGIAAIGADRVWHELGIDGTGVIVGNIDTGVDGNHPALSHNWHGLHVPADEAWLDAAQLNDPSFPRDRDSHGTHVMGTICGSAPGDSIGVAPGATWIATNAINQYPGSVLDNSILASLAFMADPDGDPATSDDVPAVVQNSWGVGDYFAGYEYCDSRWWDAMDACEAAGVALVWSAGNAGPDPGTVSSPADRATTPTNSFSVGATEHFSPYTIAGFSSRGPSSCGGEFALKPEISAPGVDILSARPNGGYQYMDGTSMSGPHVAGVFALMKQANPDLDVLTLKHIIMETAIDLGAAGEDNDYGHGMVDAYAAVVAAMGAFGAIEGTVADAATGLPIPGALVALAGTGQAQVVDDQGQFRLQRSPGNDTLVVEAYGYHPDSLAVAVIEDQVTDGSISLHSVPRAMVHGHVTDPDGLPVEGALVRTLDAPLGPVVSDASGYYQLMVPLGATYDFHAAGPTADLGTAQVQIVATADQVWDVRLPRGFVEGFEAGFFGTYDWEMDGWSDWEIDDEDPYDGLFSAWSGITEDSKNSVMTLTLDVIAESEITFTLRVDSEVSDELAFFIDNVKMGAWWGDAPWQTVSFTVSPGVHTFAWAYIKNFTAFAGADAAWVDNIELPTVVAEEAPLMGELPDAISVIVAQGDSTTVPLPLGNSGPGELRFAAVPSSEDLIAPGGGTVGRGGPDTHGHYWFDQTNQTGPVFDWIDISADGTDLGAADNTRHGPFDLGFTYDHYGESHTQAYICANGFMSFISTAANASNTDIPRTWAPNGIVSPFWDDLDPGLGGSVSYLADAANERFIVTWDSVPHKGGDPAVTETFQVVIQPDGILFQYLDVSEVESCTVGLENVSGTVALQVAFNEPYLEDGTAIWFQKVEPWLVTSPEGGAAAPGSSTDVALEFLSWTLPLGVYEGFLSVRTNDPVEPWVDIPVTMDIRDPALSDVADIPMTFALGGAYPNPFNPLTRIDYSVPAGGGEVNLKVYDVAGSLVRTLVNGHRNGGQHTTAWNGRDEAGLRAASGVYFYRLEAPGFVETRKMTLVK